MTRVIINIPGHGGSATSLGAWDGILAWLRSHGVEVHLGVGPDMFGINVGRGDPFVYVNDRGRPADVPTGAIDLVVMGNPWCVATGAMRHVRDWAHERGYPLIVTAPSGDVPLAALPELLADTLGLPTPALAAAVPRRRLPLPPVYSPATWGYPSVLYDQAPHQTILSVAQDHQAMHRASWMAQLEWEVATGRGVRAYDLAQVREWFALGHGYEPAIGRLLGVMYRHCTDEELTIHRPLTAVLWQAALPERAPGSTAEFARWWAQFRAAPGRHDPITAPMVESQAGVALLAVLRGEGARHDLPLMAAALCETVGAWVTTAHQDGSLLTLLGDGMRVARHDHPAAGGAMESNRLLDVVVEMQLVGIADPLEGAPLADLMTSPMTWRAAAQHRSPPDVVRRMAARPRSPRVSTEELVQAIVRFVAAHPPRSPEMLAEWEALARNATSLSVLTGLHSGVAKWPTVPPGMGIIRQRYEARGGKANLALAAGPFTERLPVGPATLPLARELADRNPPAPQNPAAQLLQRCLAPTEAVLALDHHDRQVRRQMR